jgi:hypothetical protein
MLEHDRGRYVREQEGYRKLLAPSFSTVDMNLHTELFTVRHTILMTRCSN